ncbi:hypothetical protein GCM10009760_25950 [Kitasatospora kazusensis]|uniref:Uncharacterized protein n=1 Tax=Kitasatospora kazusensis TaxID=407974 RepID=A0ABP5L4A6_9ACTN
MRITAHYDGKAIDLPPFGNLELVSFERKFQMSATALNDPSAVRMDWLCFLAYVALRKAGQLLPGTQYDDAFLDRLAELEIHDDQADEPAADPTAPAPALG